MCTLPFTYPAEDLVKGLCFTATAKDTIIKVNSYALFWFQIFGHCWGTRISSGLMEKLLALKVWILVQIPAEAKISFYLNPFSLKDLRTLKSAYSLSSWEQLNKYRTRAIITRSWSETALVYKPRILGLKNEEFSLLVHKWSVI